ncbi:prolyl oligopeptidase family serine peptidase [Streptomonospora nanhaiensis]|uniref:prolyl oligopeptidase family serine peptidase n=1 Tax=Streptomonospora nanhaiensis TaxID=1323731 RepID=UPI001C99B101|nr:prolyl oligopeptidase family serine peptidase [Streptomonospora nanhaiensis]MBX9387392.1 prolyl oligopeptidase family serine peptidase [Streptomonospora nanhaiensis]
MAVSDSDRVAMRPPSPRRGDDADRIHGRVVADPFRWLEDDSTPECAEWLAGQAALLERHRATWPLRDALHRDLAELIGVGALTAPVSSPPVVRRGRRFSLRRAPGQELPVLVVADPGAEPRVLVDPLALDPGARTTLDSWRPSWNGAVLAYQVSTGGSERPVLHVVRVADGTPVDSPIPLARPTPVAWLPSGLGFHYTAPDGERGRRVLLHRLGTDPADDETVYRTDRPHLAIKSAPARPWLMITTSSGVTSGNTLLVVPEPGAEPRVLHDGDRDGSRAVLKFGPGPLVLAVTDLGAPFGRVCAVDPDDPASGSWRTLIPEEPGAVLDDAVPLLDPDTGAPCLLVNRTRRGLSGLALHGHDGARLCDVPVPGSGSIRRMAAPPDSDRAWFAYTDFVTPPTVYRFDLRERRCVPEPAEGAPPAPAAAGGADPAAPRVRQVDYTAGDGTRVGMHLVFAGDPADGPRPTLLTTYGGFGASSVPGYSPTILAWVRAGGVYAVAGVRGGGEGGTAWHAAGSGANKPTAIADFLAAAEWLVAQGWTAPDRLAVKGASHSGLMAAAAITARPDLFAAAVVSDALTDMVRYPGFGLGRMWCEEFGTADDPDQLDTLLSYSPYHRVRRGAGYPAVLLTCPRTDARVDSMHTRKLTAALQDAAADTPGARPVLLRCESDVGHGMRSASRWIGLQADVLAFCAAHTGLGAGAAG